MGKFSEDLIGKSLLVNEVFKGYLKNIPTIEKENPF
jgi:hypothetical protein